MAEKETKIIRIAPSEQSAATELLRSFGWKVESAYDVVKAATPRSSGYHVVDLYVSPDPSRPNYAELSALAKEYLNSFPAYPNEPGCFSGIILAILSGFITVFLFCFIAVATKADDSSTAFSVLFALAFIVPGIVIFILRKVRYEAKWDAVYRSKAAFTKKREEILKKARDLEGNCTAYFKGSSSDSEWDSLCMKVLRQIL
jgi:hypothetical protein